MNDKLYPVCNQCAEKQEKLNTMEKLNQWLVVINLLAGAGLIKLYYF